MIFTAAPSLDIFDDIMAENIRGNPNVVSSELIIMIKANKDFVLPVNLSTALGSKKQKETQNKK